MGFPSGRGQHLSGTTISSHQHSSTKAINQSESQPAANTTPTLNTYMKTNILHIIGDGDAGNGNGGGADFDYDGDGVLVVCFFPEGKAGKDIKRKMIRHVSDVMSKVGAKLVDKRTNSIGLFIFEVCLIILISV